MVNMNTNVGGISNSIKGVWENNSIAPKTSPDSIGTMKVGNSNSSGFDNAVKAVNNYISKVDDLQQSSDMSIQDLLSGRSEDITTVVSAVAKADMSFKLLIGVRNKLIEAYKQTINMPI
jgi:flagellar hook-basal body complex protein FliE